MFAAVITSRDLLSATLFNVINDQNDNFKAFSANKPFSWQEKGWDEFVDFTFITELSLISPLRRERLIINHYLAFINYVFIKLSLHSN